MSRIDTKTKFKAELMLFALRKDYFGYDTIVKQQSNGKYRINCEGQVSFETPTSLSKCWDNTDIETRNIIIQDYASEVLL